MSILPRPALQRHLGTLLLALLSLWSTTLLGTAAHAQTLGESSWLNRLGQRGAFSQVPVESVPLEGPLDPEQYLVGPGDVFAFSIGGGVPTQQQAVVSADGTLIVPGVGSFYAAERTLAEVRTEIQAALRRTHRNVETNVALAEPRTFYVHVSGAVLEPGRHAVAPVARVEDALARAMGGVSPQRLLDAAPARQALAARALASTEAGRLEPGALQPGASTIPETRYQPSFRNVLVTHRDGTSERVDLLRYYATGDPATNPYLRDGDTIVLPFYDPDVESVGVAGAVPAPGLYDYRPDDTALALLQIALGPDARDRVSTVRLLRAGAAEAEILQAAELGTVPLEPGDRLFVVDDTATYGTARVVGAARFPAAYPIRVGATTLGDLVVMAGGTRPDALLRGAYLERQGFGQTEAESTTPDPSRLAFDPTLSVEIREAALSAALFDQTRLSTLDFASRLYFGREVLGYQRVSVNVQEALREDGSPVYLRDGDRLVIPFDPGAVAVIGQVTHAGYVPFEDGRMADYYVAQAGGRTPGATEGYVVDASTGVYQPLEDAGALQPGDFIFVNRSPVAEDRLAQQILVQQRQVEVQERRERADARFRLITTSLTAVGTALSLAGFIISLAR